VRQFATSPVLPVHFYVEAGLFETAIPSPVPGLKNFLVAAHHMRDVLLARGYTIHDSEFSGGHNPLNWRGSLADGLMALLGTNAP
jgi:enterochelin esterase family protein